MLNAANLSDLPDEKFDAALMLGPLYHLLQEEERKAAVQELYRVTKREGVVYVAFRSRINMIMTSLQHPKQWRPHDNLNAIDEFSRTGIFNHSDKGRYTGAYFFDVDEIEPFMESHGFATIDLIGSTNIGVSLSEEQKQYWEQQGEEEYKKLTELLIRTAKDKSVLGMSSHLMYIGKKKSL
ncbi:class I SAM-dependent methyltransferase [Cohnella kolymensis]|uniref:class I SAM-dependent methyltransferase n=1 Tax=Cohnella kolymensis TaxID=1590652 RepID=UPI000A926B5F|nr:methyltransferase domain-containing protein [Cohnella kolymensis]